MPFADMMNTEPEPNMDVYDSGPDVEYAFGSPRLLKYDEKRCARLDGAKLSVAVRSNRIAFDCRGIDPACQSNRNRNYIN